MGLRRASEVILGTRKQVSPPSSWGRSATSFPLSDSHVLEKSPRLDQICGLEALRKSVTHRCQKIVRLPGTLLLMPETRKARCRSQLPRERALRTRRVQRSLQQPFRGGSISLAFPQEGFCLDAQELGRTPSCKTVLRSRNGLLGHQSLVHRGQTFLVRRAAQRIPQYRMADSHITVSPHQRDFEAASPELPVGQR